MERDPIQPRLELPERWQEVTQSVIGAAMRVHSTLGPGLLEKLYEDALCIELEDARVSFDRQKPVRLRYRGREIGDFRMDLVVAGLVIVEMKAIEQVLDVHKAQLLSYLRSADLPIGLLINFNHPTIKQGLTRRINERSSLWRTQACSPPSTSADLRASAFLPSGGQA